MNQNHELLFRTEDIRPADIQNFYVETKADRRIVEALKGKAAVVLQGSRGVGKSFVLRVAQSEMDAEFDATGVLPVYVTFNKAGLIQTDDPLQFSHWMMAKLCNRIVRAVEQRQLVERRGSVLSGLARLGRSAGAGNSLAVLESQYENSWRSPGESVTDGTLEPQSLADALEDLCESTDLRRVVLLVDEAAHVFIPEQQRQFFTLMRDLRSPYLSVKAAIYPGVTSFGDSFQMTHDATLLTVDRDVLDSGYLQAMREIVQKQDPSLGASIERYGEVFDALAFASAGNPRVLLKVLTRSTPFNTANVQRALREYFRETIWSEHSSLGERYRGHRRLIDWGREFVEKTVVPTVHERNEKNVGSEQSIALWIHRDAPASIKESLRLLCYSGILQEAGSGLRATRSGTGARYVVNAGCLIVQGGSDLIPYATRLRRGASIRRMVEFGPNHRVYRPIENFDLSQLDDAEGAVLDVQLQRSIDDLDLSAFLRSKLDELGFRTIGQVLNANELDFRAAYMVGEVRSRQMKNAAVTAVMEYISG